MNSVTLKIYYLQYCYQDWPIIPVKQNMWFLSYKWNVVTSNVMHSKMQIPTSELNGMSRCNGTKCTVCYDFNKQRKKVANKHIYKCLEVWISVSSTSVLQGPGLNCLLAWQSCVSMSNVAFVSKMIIQTDNALK